MNDTPANDAKPNQPDPFLKIPAIFVNYLSVTMTEDGRTRLVYGENINGNVSTRGAVMLMTTDAIDLAQNILKLAGQFDLKKTLVLPDHAAH